MRTREQFLLAFFFFLFLSVVVIFLGKTTFGVGFLELLLRPFQNGVHALGSIPEKFSKSNESSLQQENQMLRQKLLDQETLQKENSALKDQFAISNPKSSDLLPAKVLGTPTFIPSISLPSTYIIGLGKADGVKVGQAVVVKDNVLGKVTKNSQHLSVVTILTDPSISFAAQTENGVLGVLHGEGQDTLLFDNVLSSETLHVGDTVVTKGDINDQGIGYPANLIVGKITSIDKTQSNLFQSAQVKSLLDFSKLSLLFLVVQNQ